MLLVKTISWVLDPGCDLVYLQGLADAWANPVVRTALVHGKDQQHAACICVLHITSSRLPLVQGSRYGDSCTSALSPMCIQQAMILIAAMLLILTTASSHKSHLTLAALNLVVA